MKQATAWFRYYNPLLQKPTTLEPVMPWGFWWYYGPDPAAGESYGRYKGDSGHEVITKQAKKVYSPVDGKPMRLVEPVDLSKMGKPGEAKADMSHRYKCESCQSVMVSNVELLDEGHCTACGHSLAFHSKHKEIQAMNIELKEKVRAHILKKRAEAQKAAQAAAAPEKNAEASVQIKQKREALRARIKARLAERKAKATAADEWVDLDEVLEEKHGEKAKANPEPPGQDLEQHENFLEELEEGKMLSAEEKAAQKAADEKDGKLEGEHGEDEFMPLDMVLSALERKQRIEKIRASLAQKRRIRARARIQAARARARASAAAQPRIAREVRAGENAQPRTAREVRAAKEARAAKVAAFKARIAAKLKARAALKVRASDETPAEEHEEKLELNNGANAVPTPPPEIHEGGEHAEGDAQAPGTLSAPLPAPHAENPEAVHEVSHMPSEPTELETADDSMFHKGGAEAMKYEPLASLESLKAVAREDIDMIRYNEDKANPFWNVSVKGTPVARISLKAQISPDEIRNVFISDDYAMDLIEHCATSGLVDTLKKVNAFFYANHTSNKKVAASYKAAADKSIATAKAELAANFKGEFLNCLRIAIAGINKNFYPNLGNPLKEQLYFNMKTLGLPDSSAKSVVEKAFAEASAEYFDSVFTKADEYMKLAAETRTEIAEAISQASAIDPSAAAEPQEPATLAKRLTQASVVPQMTMAFESQPLIQDTQDFKARLKRAWKPTR
jgi:hypothetical protein